MKIALLCPTRGRPDGMERLWKSAYETAQEKENLIIVFRIDKDDQVSHLKYIDLAQQYGNQVREIVCDRHPSLGKATNDCLWMLEKDVEILHLAGDDLIFRTEFWDEEVRKVFKQQDDHIFLAYGSDLYISDNQRFGTHPFLHKKQVEILGYAVTDVFVGSYLDTYLNRVYDIINRKIKLPIIIEHMHGAANKAIYDQTMLEKFEREKKQNSGMLFYEIFPKIKEDALKLWEYIKSYENN